MKTETESNKITVFGREDYVNVVLDIQPLIKAHWREIAHYKDIPLDPDYDKYKDLEDLGLLRIFVAREEGELIGYAIFFLTPHIHYKSTKMAIQDILFLRQDKRGGTGYKFIKWCDEQLKAEGVEVVTQHIKAKHNFGKMLERLDYELMDLIYTRRLN